MQMETRKVKTQIDDLIRMEIRGVQKGLGFRFELFPFQCPRFSSGLEV
jgi:hypothetical protein